MPPLPSAIRWIAGGSLAIVLLLGTTAAADDGHDLTTYSTPHYAVHTDLSRAEAELYATHMHRVFTNYRNRFDDFPVQREGAMALYLFHEREDYVNYMADQGIKAGGTGGLFFVTPTAAGLATFTAGRNRSQTFAVLQHEGFHQFAYHHLGTQLPIWLNEGLAQYFEDGVLIRGKMTLGLSDADRIERVRRAIEAGTALPIERVLEITLDQWHGVLATDPDRAALLYAQSWSMVYFMLHVDGGKHQTHMSRYLRLVAEGAPSGAAFEQAFGESDLAKMEQNWRRFALAQQPAPINAAMARLEFFGQALRFMAERGEKMPNSFGDLQRNMQQRRFTLRRTSTGIDATLDAADDDLFRFRRENGTFGRFVLLEAVRDDLPPRISAEGLSPEPTLVWFKSAAGELVADIEFR